MRFLHENPELHGAKLRFLQFLCIAKRVIVCSMPLYGMVGTATPNSIPTGPVIIPGNRMKIHSAIAIRMIHGTDALIIFSSVRPVTF